MFFSDETVTRYCRTCKTNTDQAFADGANQAATIYLCETCDSETAEPYMTEKEILAEARRGY